MVVAVSSESEPEPDSKAKDTNPTMAKNNSDSSGSRSPAHGPGVIIAAAACWYPPGKRTTAFKALRAGALRWIWNWGLTGLSVCALTAEIYVQGPDLTLLLSFLFSFPHSV